MLETWHRSRQLATCRREAAMGGAEIGADSLRASAAQFANVLRIAAGADVCAWDNSHIRSALGWGEYLEAVRESRITVKNVYIRQRQ